MNQATAVVQEFFEQYARSRSAMDIDRLASQYADTCMFAGPDGARVAEKKDVLAGFPKVLEWLKSVGHTSTTLASLNQTTVDEHYAIVRAQIVWRFEKAAAAPIEITVDSTFMLYTKEGVPSIVFQQEREDFWQALRTRGLLPAQ